MGIRYARISGKLYESQLKDIDAGLKSFFDNSAAKMTKERYLMMKEQLGEEPDMKECPPDYEDFPYDVQVAINIYHILPDVWLEFSGTYAGKSYAILPYLMDEIYEVANKRVTMQYILMINNIIVDIRSKEQKQRQQRAKSKGKKGINIQG